MRVIYAPNGAFSMAPGEHANHVVLDGQTSGGDGWSRVLGGGSGGTASAAGLSQHRGPSEHRL
ncbi:hypothetical protein NSND_50811 [Nitrospira sp. ND1]|nr:hypothetical protein NSND_50811 [Nitrospira sp. ND1]